MNCRTCRHEISESLDGRLPSGRRKIIMGHLRSCEPCLQFWKELQSAQKLVMQLPRQRTSSGFREQLFERIKTGEGTPEAVFLEPIPMAKKIRYAMTGAAAAAAVLITATLVRNSVDATPNTSTEVASTGTSSSTTDAEGYATPAANETDVAVVSNPFIDNLEPSSTSNSLLINAKPLTVDLFANEAATQLAEHVSWTNDNLNKLEAEIAPSTIRAICESAVEIEQLGSLLVEMHEREQVVFSDPQVNVQLRFAVEQFGANSERLRMNTIDTVRTVVGPVLRSSNRLTDVAQIFVRRTGNIQVEEHVVFQLTQSQPEAFQSLFFVLPQEAFPSFDPRNAQTLVLGQCGPNFCVAPRSRVVRETMQWQQLQQLMGSMSWPNLGQPQPAAPTAPQGTTDPLKPR
ncbi:MAG: hypothetical protein VYE77_05715 [Planctomycetota bacterium]|nr:hypothetical protein [Planctomycetota bacterium]